MNRKVLICFLCLFLSSCASTYDLPSDIKTSLLTVRSPQGQHVSASIYESAETCSEKKILKSSQGSKASKTYAIPSSQVLYSVRMHSGSANSFQCEATIKMDAEEGQHYVVDLIADKGKLRCNNRIFNVKNKELKVNAQYVNAVEFASWASKTNFCDKYEFTNIASPRGEFTSTAYRNTPYSTGVPGVIGTTNSRVNER